MAYLNAFNEYIDSNYDEPINDQNEIAEENNSNSDNDKNKNKKSIKDEDYYFIKNCGEQMEMLANMTNMCSKENTTLKQKYEELKNHQKKQTSKYICFLVIQICVLFIIIFLILAMFI